MKAKKRSLQELLEEVGWLRDLPMPVRQRVHADAYETFHPAGGAVARIGDPSNSWIGVSEGLLKVSTVSKSGRVVIFTGVPKGGWIGEGAVIKRELRRYDILAMRDSRLMHIPGSTLRWLLDTSIEFNHVMVNQLNERLAQYITMVEVDRLEDPVARVARSIATLFNKVLYPRITTAVPMSQSELAELVGLSRQSISLALKRLKEEGLISTEYGGLVIENLAALRDYEERSKR